MNRASSNNILDRDIHTVALHCTDLVSQFVRTSLSVPTKHIAHQGYLHSPGILYMVLDINPHIHTPHNI